MAHKTNETRDAMIIEEYNKGVLVREICKKHEVSRGTVTRVTKNCKRRISNRRNKATANVYNIIRDYQNGLPMDVIYEKYDLCSKAVYRILSLYNIPMRHPKRGKYDYLKPKIIRDYTTTHMSVRQIAEEYNVSINVVYRTIQKAGVEYRKPKKETTRDKNVNVLLNK